MFMLSRKRRSTSTRLLKRRAPSAARAGAEAKTGWREASPTKLLSLSSRRRQRTRAAATGDMVVRNRCPESGNEEFLVPSAKFASRYEGPTGPAGEDGGAHIDRAARIRFVVVNEKAASSPSWRPGRGDGCASRRCDRAGPPGPEGHLGFRKPPSACTTRNIGAIEVMK